MGQDWQILLLGEIFWVSKSLHCLWHMAFLNVLSEIWQIYTWSWSCVSFYCNTTTPCPILKLPLNQVLHKCQLMSNLLPDSVILISLSPCTLETLTYFLIKSKVLLNMSLWLKVNTHLMCMPTHTYKPDCSLYLTLHAATGLQQTLMKQGFGTQWVALEPVSPCMRQPTSSAIDFQLTLKWLPVKDDLSVQLRGAYLARHHVGRLMREMAGRQTQETLSWAYWGTYLMNSPRSMKAC